MGCEGNQRMVFYSEFIGIDRFKFDARKAECVTLDRELTSVTVAPGYSTVCTPMLMLPSVHEFKYDILIWLGAPKQFADGIDRQVFRMKTVDIFLIPDDDASEGEIMQREHVVYQAEIEEPSPDEIFKICTTNESNVAGFLYVQGLVLAV